jgi:ABC-type spermidine/putrescine transport system permease subunit II
LPSCRRFSPSYSLGVGKGRLAVVFAVIRGFFIYMPIYMHIIFSINLHRLPSGFQALLAFIWKRLSMDNVPWGRNWGGSWG